MRSEAYVSCCCIVGQRPCFPRRAPDEGGPLVAELLKNAGYEVVRTDVVPDEQAQIEAALRQMADDGDIQLLVTTGGTGFAPRT